MASTKSLHFKLPYLRQNWSIPDSIIYSITKNPSNAKAWQKLIHSCKYFFAKNAILVVDELNNYDHNKKWKVVFFRVKNGEETRFSKSIDFKSVLCKIWLTEIFWMPYVAQPFNNLVPSVIPYFYRCDIKKSQIFEDVYLNYCVVKNKNDEIVPLEKLFKALPKIQKFVLLDNLISSSITSMTFKELLKIPHFSKITGVYLWGLPEKFDLETFYIYFKKNKYTKFHIEFRDDAISEAYKIRIEAIVDEIIATENRDYKIPNIYFGGLPREKCNKIGSLFYQQNEQWILFIFFCFC